MYIQAEPSNEVSPLDPRPITQFWAQRLKVTPSEVRPKEDEADVWLWSSCGSVIRPGQVLAIDVDPTGGDLLLPH